MVKSGITRDYGIGFWGPNGHDGVWHISLIRSLASGSFEMPIFAGEVIKNYHVGFDLLLALVNKITQVPISILYFQILPPVFSVLIGALVYKFVFNWKKSKSAALWSTFFVYFGGNIGWIITFIRDSDLAGESMFWAQPSALTLINPPYALSLILILSGLVVLQSQRKFSSGLLSIIFFGILIQVKAYAGVIILGALLATAIYEFWRVRALNYFKLFLGSLLVSLVIFLPNLQSGSLLEFKPLWFLETMMSFPDRLGWVRFGDAMVNYRLGGQWVKAILAYGLALIIFWYGNLGARFVNEFYWVDFIKNKKRLELLDVFFGSMILIGFVMSLLFVQKGTAWNTIQFFYYSLFFISILAGIVFAGIIKTKKNIKIKKWLILGVVVFTLPTTVSTLKHYLPTRPPAMIPNYELEALEYLSKQPRGVVLVMPFDREAALEAVDNPPRPLYLYESTAYVSAYSGQPVWLEDEVNLDITGYNWRSRRSQLAEILSLNNSKILEEFLEKENIAYIYVTKDSAHIGLFSEMSVDYENELVSIY
jgi:hypothetical protein